MLKLETLRCNPSRRTSLQQNKGGIYNENKSRATKNCRKTAPQAETLPNTRRARRHHQLLRQYLVKKCTSMKQEKNAQGAKSFCCHQCEKRFTENSQFTKHTEIHRKGKHGCQDCAKKISVGSRLATHMQTRSE